LVDQAILTSNVALKELRSCFVHFKKVWQIFCNVLF